MTDKSTLPLSEAPPLKYHHTPENINALLSHLPDIENTASPSDLFSKSHTPHSPALPSQHPSVVFFPQSTEEVSRILKNCHERRIAVTSFSGGTSIVGALAATRPGGVCIDFGRMDRVWDVNVQDQDVRVQPGVGWVELNEELEGRGFWFPVDPAKGARIGGMVWFSISLSTWIGYQRGDR